jgi:hypothetical protein
MFSIKVFYVDNMISAITVRMAYVMPGECRGVANAAAQIYAEHFSERQHPDYEVSTIRRKTVTSSTR